MLVSEKQLTEDDIVPGGTRGQGEDEVERRNERYRG